MRGPFFVRGGGTGDLCCSLWRCVEKLLLVFTASGLRDLCFWPLVCVAGLPAFVQSCWIVELSWLMVDWPPFVFFMVSELRGLLCWCGFV